MSYDAPPGAGGIRRLAVQGCQLENNPPDWASWATEPVTHRPPPSWPGHPAELYGLQRVRSMLQHGTSLLNRYAREPCDKIGQLRSVFKVLKESGNRHASPTEYPGTTDFLRVALHGRASRPVVHDVTLRLQQASFNLADHSLVEQRAAHVGGALSPAQGRLRFSMASACRQSIKKLLRFPEWSVACSAASRLTRIALRTPVTNSWQRRATRMANPTSGEGNL